MAQTTGLQVQSNGLMKSNIWESRQGRLEFGIEEIGKYCGGSGGGQDGMQVRLGRNGRTPVVTERAVASHVASLSKLTNARASSTATPDHRPPLQIPSPHCRADEASLHALTDSHHRQSSAITTPSPAAASRPAFWSRQPSRRFLDICADLTKHDCPTG